MRNLQEKVKEAAKTRSKCAAYAFKRGSKKVGGTLEEEARWRWSEVGLPISYGTFGECCKVA